MPRVSSSKGDESPGARGTGGRLPTGVNWGVQFTTASQGILQDRGKLARWTQPCRNGTACAKARRGTKHTGLFETPGLGGVSGITEIPEKS